MAERTPNGPSDLLADESQPAAPADNYTIDDEDDPRPRGSDPAGSNEREPSLVARLSTEGDGGGILERKPSRQKEAALAEKTSKIMSDYQAYLSEITTEFPHHDDDDEEASAERGIADVREAHRVDRPGGIFPPPVDGEYGEAGALYRGWNRRASEADDDDEDNAKHRLHIDRGVADFEDRPSRFGSTRSSRFGSRKRVARGMITIVVLTALVAVGVVVSNAKKRASLPDWEAELAESEATATASPPEFHPEMSASGTAETDAEIADLEPEVTQAEMKGYKIVSERFEPSFYDRSAGWTGRRYVDALSFCQESNPYKNERERLCPYMVLCPNGQGSRPLGGHKNENGELNIMEYGGSWMPVIDGPNQWVSVGLDNSCVLWSDLHGGENPDWGNTGRENERNTRHVACCNSKEVEKFEEEELHAGESAEEEALTKEELAAQQAEKEAAEIGKEQMAEIAAGFEKEEEAAEASLSNNGGMSAQEEAEIQEEAIEMNQAVAEAKEEGFQFDEPTKEELEQLQAEGALPQDVPEVLPYVIASQKFEPVYFDRTGWTGETYRDAVEFCSGINEYLHVCPFEAVCPEGIGEHPIREFAAESIMWIPVADEANSWVSVTKKQPCLPFKNKPDWGNTTAHAMTEHLMCCKLTHDTANMIKTVADLPGVTAAEAIIADVTDTASDLAAALEDADGKVESAELKQQKNQALEDIERLFAPQVFDRSHGWTGQTFLEALEFCSNTSSTGSNGERSICPLVAVCPMGKGNDPTTGPKDGPNGGFSWVPISDNANAWVQVSSKDTCLPYDYVHNGENPQWGLDGKDNEELTRYLYCCHVVAGNSDEGTPAGSVVSTPETTPNPTPESTPNPTLRPTGLSATAPSKLSSEEEMELYKVAAQVFQPLVFNRNSEPAWTGMAYLEAIQFCAAQDSRVPCPYTGICPAGKGHLPVGGISMGWSPILNSPNGWVWVGPGNTCATYIEINKSPPQWGLTGEGDPDLAQSIACCVDAEDEKSEETSKSENNPASPLVLTETEQVVLDNFKPEWFGRGAGYTGTTYDEAIEFCSTVAGKSLCPYEAYCPDGDVQGSLYLQHDAFEGEQWAPVLSDAAGEGIYSYVMIGTQNGDPSSTCRSYFELTGNEVPYWSIDGTSTELKQQVLCCLNPTFSTQGVITPTVEEDLNTQVTQTEDSPTLEDGSFDLEGAVNLDLEPVWLDEEDGWEGGSHDDAETFCEQTVGRSLCPFLAYCPHGPGQPTISGHDVDFKTQGIQWAPVYGADNHWVLLSQKGGNSATTCMTHVDLEGTEPDWGLSGARPWLKKHILCCNLGESS